MVTTSSAPAASSMVDKRIDQLVQAFNKLTINMGAFVQQSQNHSPLYPPINQYLYPRNPQTYSYWQQDTPKMQGVGVNAFGTGIDMKDTCFYCWNRNPDYPPHRFWNQCPRFQKHIAAGTVHLNQNNRLCLGPPREGA